MSEPIHVTHLKLLQKQHVLSITFNTGECFDLPCDYLREHSPSADMRKQRGSKTVNVPEKQNVNIIGIDPIGHYAVKLIFDDGHDTGLYSWEILYDLAKRYVP